MESVRNQSIRKEKAVLHKLYQRIEMSCQSSDGQTNSNQKNKEHESAVTHKKDGSKNKNKNKGKNIIRNFT